MKKLFPLFALIIILLSSCSTGFHNGKQYANRRYVKIGPGISTENNIDEVKIHVPSTQVMPVESKVVSRVDIKESKPEKINSSQSTSKKSKTGFFKTTIEKIKNIFPQKSKELPKHVEKHKSTKSTSFLNIIGFIFGIISVVLGFITAIMFLFTLAFPATAAACITMVIVVCSLAFVALVFSITGVALQSPKRGLGIAGIITAGIAVLIVLLSLLLFFVFL